MCVDGLSVVTTDCSWESTNKKLDRSRGSGPSKETNCSSLQRPVGLPHAARRAFAQVSSGGALRLSVGELSTCRSVAAVRERRLKPGFAAIEHRFWARSRRYLRASSRNRLSPCHLGLSLALLRGEAPEKANAQVLELRDSEQPAD
jgi:hypothetical protein